MPPKPGRADAKPPYVPKQNATYVPKQKVTYVPKQNVTPKPTYSALAVKQAYARPLPRQIMIPGRLLCGRFTGLRRVSTQGD